VQWRRIAPQAEWALRHATQFKFSALLIGIPPHFKKTFTDAFGDVPILFYGRPSNVIPIRKSWVAVRKDVPEILGTLKQAPRTP
jgi:hypothetical protein